MKAVVFGAESFLEKRACLKASSAAFLCSKSKFSVVIMCTLNVLPHARNPLLFQR